MGTTIREHLADVGFTIPTPFSDDTTEILYEELKKNVQRLLAANGKLIIPCGNTGEYYSLTREERIGVAEATVDAVGDRGSVVAGVGGSTKTVQQLLASYEDIGVDGAMIMYPRHTYVHAQGLKQYYYRILDSTELDIVLYKRGSKLSNDTIIELSNHRQVVGVKYAVNDIDGFARVVNQGCNDVVWIDGLAERFAPAFGLEGADGLTTGIGNFIPEAILALYDAIDRRDWKGAQNLRDLVQPYEALREEPGIENGFPSANNVPAVKFGLELSGYYGGPVREPLVELADEDKQRAENYYTAIMDGT